MEFVRLLRSSGWHQARASRELGVSTATISRYVSGEQEPSLPVLRLFADSINDQLLIDGEQSGQRAREGARFLDEWEHELLGVFRRLKPEDRERATIALSTLLDAMMSAGRRRTPRAEGEAAAESGHEPGPESEDMKRVADQLGSALDEAVKVLRNSETGATDEGLAPPVRDPSRPTSQRSVPRQRRDTTKGP